ncbi:GxxExxY protein [Patescibacteria group bacterium]
MTDGLLHEELSFDIRGSFISVRQALGKSHKEKVYYQALKEEFSDRGISFIHEPSINIFYPKTGKRLGYIDLTF